MTTDQSEQEPNAINYREGVRLPMIGIGLLGLVLGVTAGVLTGVAIRNVVGDEPIIEGSSASTFYVAFGLAVLLDVFLLFNFTNLVVRVNENGFEVRYGMFSKSLGWSSIQSAESTDYRWISYGGWGIRFSTGGRRAWSQIGAKRGVVISASEGSTHRRYFVSSNRPEELADLINSRVQPDSLDSGANAVGQNSDSTES